MLPDYTIFAQGRKADQLFFIAAGECQVGVNDHMYRLILVRQIQEGDYFGEVSLLFGIDRTATVVTSNYCTLAYIASEHLLRLLHSYSEIFR